MICVRNSAPAPPLRGSGTSSAARIGIESVLELALCDVGSDFGSAVDQSFVFQNSKRLANGVARHQEFGRQLLFGRQPVGVGVGMDLLAQDVGDPTGTVGPRSANRYWLRHAVTLTRLGGISGAADQGMHRSASVMRRLRFRDDQPKPMPFRLLRHFGAGGVFPIPVSRMCTRS